LQHKTTSSIFITETNKGYQFGLNFYGVSLGMDSYANKKDGLGLSVRKVVEASMIDLIAKSIGIKTFQVIPEIQANKTSKKITHLSNFDFCSDMNKLVFYTDALKNKKFNSFGITNESELNKLECLQNLYDKEKNVLVKIKAVSSKKLSLSQTQRNAHLIRKKLSLLGIPRDNIIIENKKSTYMCEKEVEFCSFLANRVEIMKVQLR
jgi:arginine deiminase